MTTKTTTETRIAPVFSPFKGGRSLQRKSWINRSGKLVAAALAAGMALGLAGTASAAIILYQENFDGSSAADLDEKTPSSFTSGAHGVPSGAEWTALDWKQDGSIAGGGGASAFLPFDPQNGWVYTLTATLNAGDAASNQNSWTGLAFTENNNTSGGILGAGNSNSSAFLYRTENSSGTSKEVVSFNVPPSATDDRVSHGAFDPAVTLSMVLDTTESNWSTEFFINGSSVRTHTFTGGNPTINHVGFGRVNNATGPIDSFQLSAIPEPGSLALLGAGVGLLLLWRRRS